MIKSRFWFHVTNYIFHRQKDCVFVHVPKTAGSSIGGVVSSKSRIMTIGHNLRDKSYTFPRDLHWFKDLYSFAFVRNPWDRLVSSYYYLKNGGNCVADLEDYEHYFKRFKSFEHMLENWEDSFYNQIHMMPQARWLYDGSECIVNYIGKFERLQQDMNHILNTNNMIPRRIKHTNASKHKKYTKYYNKTTKKIVSEIYKDDIEKFNYKYD